MPATRFKKLFPKLKLVPTKVPRTTEGRLAKLESEISNLRGTIRELIEVLEAELHTDLDRDQRIGKVTRGGMPKTARINPSPQKVRVRQKPEPLPPAFP
jgi:hypothetical protein